ncbi:unnamed protein product [Cyprideis torosa]|uniref:Uncharacterized protein n=1 Tax=Cyprideis torosa TaxID=163714 RepID=A0A7R8ZV45_9CRUS|nr:unnamed protein product [Cyprideis torosa]CAG0902299.1 unnamed protein product [Cyprideis torosa]
MALEWFGVGGKEEAVEALRRMGKMSEELFSDQWLRCRGNQATASLLIIEKRRGETANVYKKCLDDDAGIPGFKMGCGSRMGFMIKCIGICLFISVPLATADRFYEPQRYFQAFSNNPTSRFQKNVTPSQTSFPFGWQGTGFGQAGTSPSDPPVAGLGRTSDAYLEPGGRGPDTSRISRKSTPDEEHLQIEVENTYEIRVRDNERREVRDDERREVRDDERREVRDNERREVRDNERREVQDDERREVRDKEQREVRDNERREVRDNELRVVRDDEGRKVRDNERREYGYNGRWSLIQIDSLGSRELGSLSRIVDYLYKADATALTSNIRDKGKVTTTGHNNILKPVAFLCVIRNFVRDYFSSGNLAKILVTGIGGIVVFKDTFGNFEGKSKVPVALRKMLSGFN